MNSSISPSEQLQNWVNLQLPNLAFNINLISGDASFRKYYRVELADKSLIAVNSPPAQENNPLFVNLAKKLKQAGLNTPEVIAADFEMGFMLLSDFGDIHLANLISSENYSSLYQSIFPVLNQLQQLPTAEFDLVDKYSSNLVQFEMSLFNDWFVEQHLGLKLNTKEHEMLNSAFEFISNQFQQQPQVLVHRDFHSRNIMFAGGDINQLGLIDFQGALIGPITYDLVSLLKDCYLIWPQDKVTELAETFRQTYQANITKEAWHKWFDLTGLQRHIKCAGIFSRLAIRDDKPNYLKHIPDVMNYIYQVCIKYPELTEFAKLIESKLQLGSNTK